MRAQNPTLLVILGAGGHGRVAADAALAAGTHARVVATDRDPGRCQGEFLPGVSLVPMGEAITGDAAVHVAIGDATAREREVRALAAHELATIVHPRASVSPSCTVGAGSLLAAQCVVGPQASLGISVIVNHGAVVDHECEVGDFSHIAPLASLSGRARVGRGVFVGSGARILPGVTVCDGTTIGAGAVVTAPVTEPGVYVGAPARRVR